MPFSPSGGAMLFRLLSKLYERTSVVITTTLSFIERASNFGNAKMKESAMVRTRADSPPSVVETSLSDQHQKTPGAPG